MAGIEQLIANPQIADLGGAYYGGVDRSIAREANKLDILARRLNYHEALKDVENKALEREMSKRKLQFGLAHQDELMEAGYDLEKMQLQDPVLDDIARDIPFVNDEESYNTFLNKHSKFLDKIPEIMGADGKPKPFKDALPGIIDFRKQRMYNIGHQRDIELANIKATAMNPQMTAPKIDNKQLDAARTALDKAVADGGLDLGDPNDSSDRRRLEYVIAHITQQINVANADAGLKTNEDAVKADLIKAAKANIKGKNWNVWGINIDKPFVQDSEIDWDSLNNTINSEFISNPKRYSIGGSSSGPAALTVPTFDTEEEAAAAGLEPGTKIIVGGRPATWR